MSMEDNSYLKIKPKAHIQLLMLTVVNKWTIHSGYSQKSLKYAHHSG